jgi:hypothetical protein
MKRLFTFATLLFTFAMNMLAEKTIYIPLSWAYDASTQEYTEDGDANKQWSFNRSKQSENCIVFWQKGFGSDPAKAPSLQGVDMTVDIDAVLRVAENCYNLNINKLGFANSNMLTKYKIIILMNYTTEWTCYGGGYDFRCSALWLNPATVKPAGHSLAHEVGHSFHYMAYAESSGYNPVSSSTDNTGFHLRCGNGQAIWEQTAQWQANQAYPELMFDQSIRVFRNSHNYAFSHEWHRYQSYWFHYYLCQYYDDITTVAQVWRTPMKNQKDGNATDFNSALMQLKGLSARDLYKFYFDYACRLATWDLDVCKPYRDAFIGDFTYRCVLTDDDQYQVALFSCPQGTGFNIIPLQVPAAGTEVKTTLTGLNVGAQLLSADPGTYLNGETGEETIAADANGYRHYVPGGPRASRGFRMGYVALMQDGTRRYFSEDSVYCQGSGTKSADYGFTVPQGVSRLWLVVSPALKNYFVHSWDESINKDDMWPYKFRLEGTDLANRATVYASATIDGREVSDVTFTYDVNFPVSSTVYYGVTASVNGRAASALGTAFQLQPTAIASKMQAWDDRGPSSGHILLYACTPDGQLSQSGFTAQGYGHWFDANGQVSSYADGAIYSEFDASNLSFSLGQYPGKCKEGQTYTIRQTLRYRKNARGTSASANFVFNITVGGTSASAILRSISTTDPTAVSTIPVSRPAAADAVYDLRGRRLSKPQPGINIINGKKLLLSE